MFLQLKVIGSQNCECLCHGVISLGWVY